MLLKNSLVASSLPYRDMRADFTAAKVGETVKIKKPATFEAKDFTSTIDVQSATETSVDVTLDKHKDVSFEIGAKERTLTLEDFSRQLIQPAVTALAEALNAYILGKYTDFNLFYSDTAFPSTIAKLAKISEIMDIAKVPLTGRSAIISPTAKTSLLGIEAFHNASIRGAAGQTAIQEAQIGRALGLNWLMDQQVPTHTAGTFASGTPATNGAVLAGATTMNINGGSGVETIKKGDIFTVADAAGQYVFTADKTATAGAITGATFYPAAPVGGFLTAKAITIKATHKANLALHPNAIALAVVPLALPMGAGQAYYVNDQGLGVRVVMGYTISTKIETCSIDMLYGAKVIQPELGVRIPE